MIRTMSKTNIPVNPSVSANFVTSSLHRQLHTIQYTLSTHIRSSTVFPPPTQSHAPEEPDAMKDNDRDSVRSPSQPVTGGGDAAGLFGKGKYKTWALAAIILLAFWSMLTGTVTLNFSSRRHGLFSGDDLVETPFREDLDVLEIEDREKLAKRMWDAYLHSERGPLPSFWQKAFEAAYEDLSGDDKRARQAAISEIARMSLGILDLDPSPLINVKKGEQKGKESNRNKVRKSLAL